MEHMSNPFCNTLEEFYERTGIYDVKLGVHTMFVLAYENQSMRSPVFLAGQPQEYKWVDDISQATKFANCTVALHFYGRFAENKHYRPSHHNYRIMEVREIPVPQYEILQDNA
jgi:hypothetical protein